MRFLHPELGWWMLGALAALGVLRWRVKRRFVASTAIGWRGSSEYRAWWLRRLPLAVLTIAVLLLGCALMEPVLPYSQTVITSRGLDIVIALDLSSSMLETMGRVRPPRTFQNLTFTSRDSAAPATAVKTRLDATKEAIKTFVGSRRDDRIALVVFSDNAYVVTWSASISRRKCATSRRFSGCFRACADTGAATSTQARRAISTRRRARSIRSRKASWSAAHSSGTRRCISGSRCRRCWRLR